MSLQVSHIRDYSHDVEFVTLNLSRVTFYMFPTFSAEITHIIYIALNYIELTYGVEEKH